MMTFTYRSLSYLFYADACHLLKRRLCHSSLQPLHPLLFQAFPPVRAAEDAVWEAETDQRLRAGDGHVRHHHHGHRERALLRRGLHQGIATTVVSTLYLPQFGQVSFQLNVVLKKGLFCQRFLYTIDMKWGLGYWWYNWKLSGEGNHCFNYSIRHDFAALSEKNLNIIFILKFANFSCYCFPQQ